MIFNKSIINLIGLNELILNLIIITHLMTVSCNSSISQAPSARSSIKSRIIGGRNADIILHPYHVSLRRRPDGKRLEIREHICSGSILSATTIITAAHCIAHRQNSNEYHIVAGTKLRKGSDGIIVPVKNLKIHEKYSTSTDQNDIALLFLAISLPINNFTIKPIDVLPDPVRVGAMGIVSGWGETGEGDADILQEIELPVISNELCNEDYRYRAYVADGMMCAGIRGISNKDACRGDSGAPFVVQRKLAGIVSWGSGCGNPEYVGVYTRISYYYSWIMRTTKEYYK